MGSKPYKAFSQGKGQYDDSKRPTRLKPISRKEEKNWRAKYDEDEDFDEEDDSKDLDEEFDLENDIADPSFDDDDDDDDDDEYYDDSSY